MTAATARRAVSPDAPPYESGWHDGKHDDRCVGVYAGTVCAHPYHSPPVLESCSGGDVHAVVDDPAAKDTLKAILPAGAPAALPELAPLTAVVEETSRAVAAWLDSAEEIEALDVLATVRAARIALAEVEAVVEGRAAKLMSGDVVEWPGGVAERHYGSKRTEWRHDDVLRKVVQLVTQVVAADATSGEVDEMLAAYLADAVDQVMATHRPEWRVTALKKIGIDPGDFCTTRPGRTTVQINTAAPA